MGALSTLAVAISLGLAQAAPAPETAPAAAAEPAVADGLFVFLYRPGPAWREGVPMHEQGLGPHARFYRGLLEQGRVFAAGGFADGDGGMAIVRAAGMDEARGLIASDPAVTSGIFVGMVEQWRPRFRTDEPLPRSD